MQLQCAPGTGPRVFETVQLVYCNPRRYENYLPRRISGVGLIAPSEHRHSEATIHQQPTIIQRL
jgi:hypothetical protein